MPAGSLQAADFCCLGISRPVETTRLSIPVRGVVPARVSPTRVVGRPMRLAEPGARQALPPTRRGWRVVVSRGGANHNGPHDLAIQTRNGPPAVRRAGLYGGRPGGGSGS